MLKPNILKPKQKKTKILARYSRWLLLDFRALRPALKVSGQRFWSPTVKMSKFIRSSNEENNASLYLRPLEIGYQSVVCKVE